MKTINAFKMAVALGVASVSLGVTPAANATAVTELNSVSPSIKAYVAALESGPLTAKEVRPLAEAGVETLDISAANTCNSFKNAVAFNVNHYTTTHDPNCGLVGTSTATKTYQWHIPDTVIGGSVCITARGYDMSAGSLGGVGYWRGLGCSSASEGTVKWENTLANPEIQHRALVAPVAGVGFRWR